MKMTSNTSITSIYGTTLMSLISPRLLPRFMDTPLAVHEPATHVNLLPNLYIDRLSAVFGCRSCFAAPLPSTLCASLLN